MITSFGLFFGGGVSETIECFQYSAPPPVTNLLPTM
nr:MAG TPA: hypothetical protein [Caudoviricetes sp.]